MKAPTTDSTAKRAPTSTDRCWMLAAAAGIIISVLFQPAVFIWTSQVCSWFVGLAEPIRVEIREASLRTEDHRAAWARARVFADQRYIVGSGVLTQLQSAYVSDNRPAILRVYLS